MQVSIPHRLETFWRAFLKNAKIAEPLPSMARASSFRGARVLLRTGLNVPLEGGRVASDFRLRAALPTIEYLKRAGARTIIVGHIGREPELSLRPVCDALCAHTPVTFVPDIIGDRARRAVEELSDGDVLMLENLRSHPGERSNDAQFARDLASLADVYVNDAFAACHREHASIVGVPVHLPHYAGIRLIKEVETLSGAFRPLAPSMLVLGGAKFATKRPLIEKFLDVYDTLFIGGALANDFLCAKGYAIGASTASSDTRGLADILKRSNVLLPVDVVVSKDGSSRVAQIDAVAEGEYICDIGPETTALLSEQVRRARYTLWNGPLGDTDCGYTAGTKALATSIADTKHAAVVGGGDTTAAIEQLRLLDAFTFCSTGGGAMLQFLATETLPGLDVLRQ